MKHRVEGDGPYGASTIEALNKKTGELDGFHSLRKEPR